MSLKVKCDGAIGLLIYGFLLMFNSNIWPNTALLGDISLQNMSDLAFDLSRSLKVKSNGEIGLPIYDFLLVANSNYMCNLHCLGVFTAARNFFPIFCLGQIWDPLQAYTHPYPGAIFFIKI